jgi:type I restriction enzyme, S subunit
MKYRIEEIGKVVAGGTPSTEEPSFWDGGIPWITPKDMSTFSGVFVERGERNISEKGLASSSAVLIPKNAVLMTSRAPIGYLGIAKNPLCTNQGFKSIICDESKVIPQYLFYYLFQNIKRVTSMAGGSTFKEISGGDFKSFVVDIPSLDKQRHIVDIR